MKTKRIVALALAGVLAAGAVAPVQAATLKSYEFTAQGTSNAYIDLHKAQADTVKELKNKEAELKQKKDEARKEHDVAEAEVIDAKTEVRKAEDAVKDQEEAIADLRAKQDKLLGEKEDIKIDYEHKFAIGRPDQLEEYLANAKYEAEKVDSKIEAAAEAAHEDNNTWPVDTLIKIFRGHQALKAKDGKNYEDHVAKIAELSAAYKETGYDTALEAKEWLENKKYNEINEKAQNVGYDIEHQKDALKPLNNVLDQKKEELTNAQNKERDAESTFVILNKDWDETHKKAVEEASKLERIELLLYPITIETIKNETNPKLVKLASENTLAYFYGKLAMDDVYLSQETLDKLGLTATTLKLYQDLLADQTDLEEPDAEEPDAEEPDAEEPDAEEPDAEEPDAEEPDAEEPTPQDPNTDAPEPVKPGASDKAEDKTPNADKKDEKNDKKANKVKNPKTGDISVLAYAGSAVLAAGAFVASKKRK